MLGWPGSDWVDAAEPLPEAAPPCDGLWTIIAGEVRHTFTHFHLVLHVLYARVPQHVAPARGRFVAPETFNPSDLPTVMRKAFNIAK
jgi:A/G-specific adenine glycosylase